MYAMACLGEFGDRPDVAVFADTGAEPESVYRWLEVLEDWGAGRGIPIEKVSYGNLKEDFLAFAEGRKSRASMLPLFVESAADPVVAAKVFRQCTRDYKINPIKAVARSMGATAEDPVEMWIGISLDEVQRMKPSQVRYIVHRWPLIERRMRRHDCLLWMEEHGLPSPPRSACYFCPFRSNSEWLRLREDDPEAWDAAVEFDSRVRSLPGMRGETFLHRSLKPLSDVDLEDPAIAAGQIPLWESWAGECEGMCGV